MNLSCEVKNNVSDNFQKSVSNVSQEKSAQSNVELNKVETFSNRDRNSFGKGGNIKGFAERQNESAKNQGEYNQIVSL